MPLPDDDDHDDAEPQVGERWNAKGGLQFSKRPQDFDPMARDVAALEYKIIDPRAPKQRPRVDVRLVHGKRDPSC